MSKKKTTRKTDTRQKKPHSPKGLRTARAWDYFRPVQRWLRTNPELDGLQVEARDADNDRASRRIEATVNTYEDMLQQLAESDIEIPKWVEADWLDRNTTGICGPDYLDHVHSTTLAVAIYILDQLLVAGHYQDAYNLIPAEAMEADLHIPEIKDVCHNEQMIRGMVWIIQHRNDDCRGLKEPGRKMLPRTMLDLYTVKNKQHQDVPSRRRFEAILSMIPQGVIAQALEQYKHAYTDVNNRMMKGHCIINDQLVAMGRVIEALEADTFAAIQDADYISDSYQARINSYLTNQGCTLPALDQLERSKGQIHAFMQSQKYQSVLQEQELKNSRLKLALNHMRHNIGLFHWMSKEQQKTLFTEELCKIWYSFTVSDPYEMCFANLYLLDQGSDLPYVYSISGPLMTFAATALPWAATRYHYENNHAAPEDEGCCAIYPNLCSTYTMFNEDRSEHDPQERDALNIAQVVYQMTGYILPRDESVSEYDQNYLSRFDLLHSAEALFIKGILISLKSLDRRAPAVPVLPEPGTIADKTQELEQRILELETKNKALRREAYTERKAAAQLREDLNAIRIANELERREVVDLRELVYGMLDTKKEREPAPETPQIFRANERIVVFGGSDVWINEMRRKCPDVRFLGTPNHPDPMIIRNADAVWLQTRHMSHSLFYTVVQEANKYGVPLRHFTSGGVGSCIEKLYRSLQH